MIYTEQSNTTPMALNCMAIVLASNTVRTNTPTYQTNNCYCCIDCEACMPVWGGGSEDWQNDKSTFAFIKVLSTDTFVYSLWKNGVKLTDITDNTLGDYVATYGANPLQNSFVIDWDKVYNSYGIGEYVFKNTYTSLGVSDVYESNKYCLSLFDSCEANGFVKIDWVQSGDILANNFKFTTPLFHSFKFKSYIEIQTPTTIKDVYQTSKRENELFRTEQKNNYLLNIKLISEKLLPLLNENMVLSNKLTVTDFNNAGAGWVEKELSFVEFSDLEDFSGVSKFDCQIKLNDYVQNIIKTN